MKRGAVRREAEDLKPYSQYYASGSAGCGVSAFTLELRYGNKERRYPAKNCQSQI